MEEQNSALKIEVTELKSALRSMDKDRERAGVKVDEVMRDMERIQCDMDSSEAERIRLQQQIQILEEDLEKYSGQGQRSVDYVIDEYLVTKQIFSDCRR